VKESERATVPWKGHDSFRLKVALLKLLLSPFEILVGDLSGAYSRRINIQHRLVYQVLKEIKAIKVIHMWTHYE
jgi:plasmid maintenance system killer protein